MYDGRIYEIGNRYALKLEAGTFRFSPPEEIEQALEEGFILGWEDQQGIFHEIKEVPEELKEFLKV